MPLNLLDISRGKFCIKIIFNICECITNFSLIVNSGELEAGGGWNTELMSHWWLNYSSVTVGWDLEYQISVPRLP